MNRRRKKKGAWTLLSASGMTADRSVRAPLGATVTFERGTGFAPELLAHRAAWELRSLLRTRSYDLAMPSIIQQVSARAERCWAAQARWRARWSRAGHPAPLLVFFRHWTAAAALREGVALPDLVRDGYGMGVKRSSRSTWGSRG